MVIALVAAGLLVGFGLLALYAGHGERRRLAKLPEVRCGEASPGPDEVKVHATAYSARPLTAPLSGRPCVAYTLTLEYCAGPGAGSSRESERERTTTEHFAEDSALRDETGELSLHGANLHLHLPEGVEVVTGMDMPRHVERLANDLLPTRDHLPIRLIERRLEPGERVFAIGRVEASAGHTFLGGEHRAELWAGGLEAQRRLSRGGDAVAVVVVVAGLGLGVAALSGAFGEPATPPSEREPSRERTTSPLRGFDGEGRR